jgi:hypothetical protein
MNTLRSTRTLASASSVITLTLLVGGAFVGRAFQTTAPAPHVAVTDDESPALCQQVVSLLEHGKFLEANDILLLLPSAPLPLESPESHTPCPHRRKLIVRLADGLIRAAGQLAADGHLEEARRRLRQCRSLLIYPGRSQEAGVLSRQLAHQADDAEKRFLVRSSNV